jgi:hypothetical protein
MQGTPCRLSNMAMENMINMEDMGLVFQVTDELGIDRESIRVDLTKEDPGSVQQRDDGGIEIVVPLSTPLDEWLLTLDSELRALGYG